MSVDFPRLTLVPSTRTCVGSCCLTDTGHLVDEVQKTSSRVAGRTPNGAVGKLLTNTCCYLVACHVILCFITIHLDDPTTHYCFVQ